MNIYYNLICLLFVVTTLVYWISKDKSNNNNDYF